MTTLYRPAVPAAVAAAFLAIAGTVLEKPRSVDPQK
jgi:hypothetical protein